MPLQRAHSDDVTQALLIGFYFEWDAALFRRLCEQGKAAVLRQYLDNFRIIPHPPRRPGRVKVYYHDLYRFYGEPWLPINDTPLYHVLNGAGEIATLVDHPVFEHVMNLKWAPTYQAKNVFVVLLIDLLVGLVFQIGLVQSMCLAPDRTGLSQFSAFGRHMYFIEAMWFLALLVSTYCSFISVDLTVARNMSMATATVMLMIEALDWNKRRWAYFKDVINWINLVAYGGVLALGILAAADLDLPHLDIARALFIVLLCFCGLDYLRMVPLTSLLISITFKMVNDVVRFVVLYGVFQIGFSGSFFLLFQHEGSRYNTYSEAFLATFLMLFGDFDADLFLRLDGAKAVVANVLVLCYLVGAMVMLMNLLIAMMSTSYQQVLDSAKVARRIARAEIILRMEGLLPHRARVYMFDHAVHDANLRHRLHALHDSDLKATGEPKPGANKMDAQETGGMNQLADKEESSSGGKKAETSKAPLLRRVDATHHTPGEGERAHRATTKTTEDRPAAHPANLAVERTFQVDGGAGKHQEGTPIPRKQNKRLTRLRANYRSESLRPHLGDCVLVEYVDSDEGFQRDLQQIQANLESKLEKSHEQLERKQDHLVQQLDHLKRDLMEEVRKLEQRQESQAKLHEAQSTQQASRLESVLDKLMIQSSSDISFRTVYLLQFTEAHIPFTFAYKHMSMAYHRDVRYDMQATPPHAAAFETPTERRMAQVQRSKIKEGFCHRLPSATRR